jgi:hypothetical protein
MMVEGAGEKRAAQRELERSVIARLKSTGVRNIGFPSGNRNETIFSNGSGSLWCAFGSAEDAKIPRRWNAFGVFDDKRHAQIITVEVNIPTTTNSAKVAGFFARDPSTDIVYLMHDGGIGGGKPGVGQNAFLAWSDHEPKDVGRSNGDVREGILIGRVESGGTYRRSETSRMQSAPARLTRTPCADASPSGMRIAKRLGDAAVGPDRPRSTTSRIMATSSICSTPSVKAARLPGKKSSTVL